MDAVESYIHDPSSSILSHIVRALDEKEINILDLVTTLGPSLTSIAKETRCNATRLLAESIDLTTSLVDGDLLHLSDFFCDRIKDHHSIVPHVLRAFCALARRQALPDNYAVMITRAIFNHAETQTLIQSHRQLAFQAISNLLDNKLKALQTMREDFTLGYIQMIDGEKDPRILMNVFNLTVRVIKCFPIKVCCEDLFEVTACYFPVDFTPPPGEGFTITRQDLADHLRIAMSSTPLFSQYCIPLLIEKISSDLQAAKQDSFRTLIECCKTYTVEDMRPFLNVITQLLIKEAMLSSSEKTEELVLQSITSVAACISSPNSDGVSVYTDVEEFCQSVLKDCKHHVFEPEHKLVTPSVKILNSLVSSGSYVCDLVLNDIIPLIVEHLSSTSVARKKVAFLGMLERLFESSQGNVSSYKNLALPLIVRHTDDANEHISSAALNALSSITDSLNEKAVDICEKLLKLYDGSDSSIVRDACSDCLSTMCLNGSSSVNECILDPISLSLTSNVKDLKESMFYLLDKISTKCGSDVCTRLLPVLLRCLKSCCQDGSKLVESVLSSLSCVVRSSADSLDIAHLNGFIETCLHDMDNITLSPSVTDHIVRIVIQLVLPSNLTDLKTLAKNYMNSLLKVNELSLTGITALQVLYCSLPPQVLDDEKNFVILLSDLVLSNQTNECNKLYLCKTCASVVNKSNSIDEILHHFNETFKILSPNNVTLWAWITKSLVVRGHKQSQKHLQQLVNLLEDPVLSSYAASAFEIILKDQPEVLNSKQRANIRLMYKQRVFVTTFPQLRDKITHVNQDLVPQCHVAITYLIQYLPHQVLMNEKQKLMEVLMKLMTSSNEEVLIRTLSVLNENPDLELMGQHVDTLVTGLIKLTQYKPRMQVRISSLQCLAHLSKLKTHLILPYVSAVIKGLVPALDDKKRLVRKEAVKARNIWCLLKDSIG